MWGQSPLPPPCSHAPLLASAFHVGGDPPHPPCFCPPTHPFCCGSLRRGAEERFTFMGSTRTPFFGITWRPLRERRAALAGGSRSPFCCGPLRRCAEGRFACFCGRRCLLAMFGMDTVPAMWGSSCFPQLGKQQNPRRGFGVDTVRVLRGSCCRHGWAKSKTLEEGKRQNPRRGWCRRSESNTRPHPSCHCRFRGRGVSRVCGLDHPLTRFSRGEREGPARLVSTPSL